MNLNYYNHEPAGIKKMRYIATALQNECARLKKTSLTILDVGCGNGHLTAFMASLGHTVVGIDTNDVTVAAAVRRYGAEPRVQFKKIDVSAVVGQFDVVTAFEVLEHIDAVDTALQSIHARLQGGGVFIMSVPNGWSLEEMLRHIVQHTLFGKKLKQWVRGNKLLEASHNQSEADSPHVRFWGFGAWKKLVATGGFVLENCSNVSLFFKQLYYMGGRVMLKFPGPVFRALNSFDSAVVRSLPRFLADGWIMTWRKK